MSWHWDDARNTGELDASGMIARWAGDEALAEDLGDAVAEQAMHDRVVAGTRSAFAAHRGMIAARGDRAAGGHHREPLRVLLCRAAGGRGAGGRPRGPRPAGGGGGGSSRTLV